MSPVTHFLTSWVLANTAEFNARERAIVTLACVAPDIDGLGSIPELLTRHSSHPLPWFSLYHHALHTLAFSALIALTAFALSRQRWKTGAFALISFHLHLSEDLLGSRGPDGDQWSISYLSPFSDRLNLTWQHQWSLNAWPNFLITLMLLSLTIYLAWRQGFSPVEIFSRKGDKAIICALRHRIPRIDA